MKKLLVLLFLPILAYSQTAPVEVQNLPQMPSGAVVGDFVVNERIGSSYNPGLLPLTQLAAFILGPNSGASYSGITIGVPFGGTGAQSLIGPIKGNGTSPFTPAVASDIANLWSGVISSACYLRGDGQCTAPPGSGTVTTTGSPVNGNLTAFSSSTAITAATSANVLSLWTGSCSSSTYLRGDGACATPAGAGTVTSIGLIASPTWLTVTGSPVTGSGSITLAATSGLAGNQVLATPAGSTGAVSLRSLVSGDLPLIPLASGVTGTLPVGNLPVIPLASGVSGVGLPANGFTGINNGTNTITITGGNAKFASPASGNIGTLETVPSSAGSPCININYTTVLADNGKMLCNSSGSAVTFTINAALSYPVGTNLFFLNPCGMGTVTIAISGGSMFLIGSASLTGTRSLAPCGAATAINYGAGVWAVGGQLITKIISLSSWAA